MSSTLATIEIVHTSCGKEGCGVEFGLERQYYNDRRRDGATFYCPNGHPRAFRDSEVDRLRAEKLRLESSLEWERGRREALRAERDLAQKATLVQRRRATRFKNDRDKIKTRIGNGVCPCCNRHFTDVERHMKSKHPSFGSAVDE